MVDVICFDVSHTPRAVLLIQQKVIIIFKKKEKNEELQNNHIEKLYYFLQGKYSFLVMTQNSWLNWDRTHYKF